MSDRIEGVRKLFTSKSARVETNRGDSYYNDLFQRCQTRLDELRSSQPLNRLNLSDLLENNSIDR